MAAAQSGTARSHGAPRDKHLGKNSGRAAPDTDRRWIRISPINYAKGGSKFARFLLIHGTATTIVDPATQSEPRVSRWS